MATPPPIKTMEMISGHIRIHMQSRMIKNLNWEEICAKKWGKCQTCGNIYENIGKGKESDFECCLKIKFWFWSCGYIMGKTVGKQLWKADYVVQENGYIILWGSFIIKIRIWLDIAEIRS